MIPGEIQPAPGTIDLNAGRATRCLVVANHGDRPIQVGSHFHFHDVNPALVFDREQARGYRLDIAAGTAVRFEPGQSRTVTLVALAGRRWMHAAAADARQPPAPEAPAGPSESPARRSTR